MEPEERFERIEMLLHAMAERENQMEIRFNQRMERSERRMDKFDRRMEAAERRMDRREASGEKFDRRLEATRKLVEVGMKLIQQLGKRHADLEKSQKAFLDSLRKGGNGNGRKHSKI